jgi:hypothetical protein
MCIDDRREGGFFDRVDGLGVRRVAEKIEEGFCNIFWSSKRDAIWFLNYRSYGYTVVSLANHGSHKGPYMAVVGLGVEVIDKG